VGVSIFTDLRGKSNDRVDDFLFSVDIGVERQLVCIGDFTGEGDKGAAQGFSDRLQDICRSRIERDWFSASSSLILRYCFHEANDLLMTVFNNGGTEPHRAALLFAVAGRENVAYYTTGDCGLAVSVGGDVRIVEAGDVGGVDKNKSPHLPHRDFVFVDENVKHEPLGPGALLILFSDGVWRQEENDADGEKARLTNLIHRTVAAAEPGRAVVKALGDQWDGKDDFSVVAVQATPTTLDTTEVLGRAKDELSKLRVRSESIHSELQGSFYDLSRELQSVPKVISSSIENDLNSFSTSVDKAVEKVADETKATSQSFANAMQKESESFFTRLGEHEASTAERVSVSQATLTEQVDRALQTIEAAQQAVQGASVNLADLNAHAQEVLDGWSGKLKGDMDEWADRIVSKIKSHETGLLTTAVKQLSGISAEVNRLRDKLRGMDAPSGGHHVTQDVSWGDLDGRLDQAVEDRVAAIVAREVRAALREIPSMEWHGQSDVITPGADEQSQLPDRHAQGRRTEGGPVSGALNRHAQSPRRSGGKDSGDFLSRYKLPLAAGLVVLLLVGAMVFFFSGVKEPVAERHISDSKETSEHDERAVSKQGETMQPGGDAQAEAKTDDAVQEGDTGAFEPGMRPVRVIDHSGGVLGEILVWVDSEKSTLQQDGIRLGEVPQHVIDGLAGNNGYTAKELYRLLEFLTSYDIGKPSVQKALIQAGTLRMLADKGDWDSRLMAFSSLILGNFSSNDELSDGKKIYKLFPEGSSGEVILTKSLVDVFNADDWQNEKIRKQLCLAVLQVMASYSQMQNVEVDGKNGPNTKKVYAEMVKDVRQTLLEYLTDVPDTQRWQLFRKDEVTAQLSIDALIKTNPGPVEEGT